MCNCENELIRELDVLLFMLHVFYNTRDEKFPMLYVQYQTFIPT